jgi:hypothetical protein
MMSTFDGCVRSRKKAVNFLKPHVLLQGVIDWLLSTGTQCGQQVLRLL